MRRARSCIATLAAVALGGVLALGARDAQACACCGSSETVKFVGWAKSGRAIALHHSVDATCELREFVAIWEQGKDEPTECYDAYGEDPTAPIPCGKVNDEIHPEGPIVPEPAVIPRPKGFDGAPRAVDPRYLMLWESQDDDSQVVELQVYVPRGAGGRFVSLDLAAYNAELGGDMFTDSTTVWPAPQGRNAVVLNRFLLNEDYEVRVSWVTLPRRFDRAVLRPEGGEVDGVGPELLPAVPETPDDDEQDYHHAAKVMARARVYERLGERRAARSRYRSAARYFAPAAVAHARLTVALGEPERGLAFLGRIDALACPSCRDALQASLGHPDFDPLRAHPAFVRLGGSP